MVLIECGDHIGRFRVKKPLWLVFLLSVAVPDWAARFFRDCENLLVVEAIAGSSIFHSLFFDIMVGAPWPVIVAVFLILLESAALTCRYSSFLPA